MKASRSCKVSGARDFDALLPHPVEVSDHYLKLRVLDLTMLINLKAKANLPKDLLTLMVALEERQKQQGNE